jgi:phospholipid/cholesterol/gamma-HCH transport system ATP-binding protein
MADAINELSLEMKEKLKVTSMIVTHDMTSVYKVADRIAMLYQGRIQALGSVEEIRNSADEVVQQFIHGKAKGPIQTL